ncbi:MAG TPA: FHA domain-containing protein [Planctomycetaceae bacterium]|nr:FHA domain-containing protein [Planctomycetaceae bacterium]
MNSSEDVILLQRADATAAVGTRLTEGTYVVGRSLECDVVINDASVSRRHAKITIEGSMVTLHDLQSRNGTFVGDEAVDSRQIVFGERIRFGNVTLIIRKYAAREIEAIETGPPSLLRGDRSASGTTALLPLSLAQRRVFDQLLAGLSEKQVAANLQLSRHTVHAHVRDIYRLLGVRSRSELLARFLRPDVDREPGDAD